MANMGGDGVAVDVRRPLEFAHVDVAGPHVLLLDVLPRPVDVHAVGGHGGGSRADAGATRRRGRGALLGARGRSRPARGGIFGRWRLFALLKAAGAARRSLRLERLKRRYIGERLSQSEVMPPAWASLGQAVPGELTKLS